MSDPRLLAANGRVAHVSLRGKVAAARYAEGSWRRVIHTTAPILERPGGARMRELLLGARFCVLESRAGACFGFAGRDGYAGYVPESALGPDFRPDHRVSAIRSHARQVPELKDTGAVLPVAFGSLLRITGSAGMWRRADIGGREWYLPAAHLGPVGQPAPDPVSVAGMFAGTPYLWGGNSAFGIDCSGLVQAAWNACALACPGDSDQQQAALGAVQAPGTRYRRGDLLFWKGHVALCLDEARMIHATAHAMAVISEPIAPAIARIKAQGGGPVLAHKRPAETAPAAPPGGNAP